MKKISCFVILVFILVTKFSSGQQIKSDSVYKKVDVSEVVVTATRTEQKIENVPVPVTIITSKEIQSSGFNRLNDVLSELTGVAVVDYFGSGLQMQGLDPDYTLIMIDNQPVIGRNGGTYDLTKIAVDNIERIEVVKGPSSALYGSEALAGVVNIITKKPKEGFSSGTKINYGSNQTTELSQSVSYSNSKFSTLFFADGFHTNGYDLDKATLYSSSGINNNGTLQSKTRYISNDKVLFLLDIRYYAEKITNKDQFADGGEMNSFDLNDHTSEFSVTPAIKIDFNKNTSLKFDNYFTVYDYHSLINYVGEGAIYYDDKFRHLLNKPEIIFDKKISTRYRATTGAGFTFEKVSTTRYNNDKHLKTSFAFAELQTDVTKRILLNIGARIDNSDIYGTHFSPKISAQYSFSEKLKVFSSWGTGFKAPDFRQLYLNFTNSVVGYSVFGSEEVNAQLAQLENEAIIDHIIVDRSLLGVLKPEISNSINLGTKYKPNPKISVEINAFRNDISNLIETQPVAQKISGQYIYSYLNLTKVYTQGIQSDVGYTLSKNIFISAGYQFLDAKDKHVIEDLKAGKIYGRDPVTFYSYKVPLENYGGLFNRSKNSFNVKILYSNLKFHWDISLRYIYHGRYGFADTNGSTILDAPQEYVNGYDNLNFAFSKEITKHFTVRATVNNMMNYTNPEYIPSISGRTYFISLIFTFNSKKSK